MDNTYDHKNIEKKWQDQWSKEELYTTPDTVDGKDNHYTLVEFAYPSGNLHVGHWYAFGVPDMYARFKRMQGYNSLFPFGFDSFGLPAENAAIKHNVDPKKWTYENIDRMREQLKTMGAMFDWSREVKTSDPSFYKWTQWLFVQMYTAGKVGKKRSIVNWDPVDKTVLANEQVLPDGTAERSGAVVEKKELDEWAFNITDYADRLIDDLDDLDWPESIKQSQKEWIGRSEGAEISFKVQLSSPNIGEVPEGRRGIDKNTPTPQSPSVDSFPQAGEQEIKVFTTRPDTLFGVTYVVLAPEHDVVQQLLHNVEDCTEVEKYIADVAKKSDLQRQKNKEKTGVELKGINAINPANNKEIPVWIADYVLAGYGTGAVMAVPAHDNRDFDFAKKFNLDIIPVCFNCIESLSQEKQVTRMTLSPKDKCSRINDENLLKALEKQAKEELSKGNIFYSEGILFNSGEFSGFASEEAKKKITEHVGGEWKTTYKIRDWGISRQRYWGCPIPIVYDLEGNAHAIREEHLPWELPTDVDFKPDGTSPLARSAELKERTEKIFGKGWTPEVDTMDTFVDSSWYFLRYLAANNNDNFSPLDVQKKWMPIDFYSGGAEHTTMHLLYSRYFYKVLSDLGLVTESEPYKKRMNRSMILAEDGRKMSKRWGNTVDPDEQVNNVGADSVRVYLAFIGPFNEVSSYPWNYDSLVGARRFIEKVWRIAEKSHANSPLSSSDGAERRSGDPEQKDSRLRGNDSSVAGNNGGVSGNDSDVSGNDSDVAGNNGDVSAKDDVRQLDKILHKTIKKVGDDLEVMKTNTAVAAMMECATALDRASNITTEQLELFIRILAPFAPHMTEEIWREQLQHDTSIHLESWPGYNDELLVDDTVTLGIQINGKVRGDIEIAIDATEDQVRELVFKHEDIKKYLEGDIGKFIYVPGRIISIVVT